MLSQEKIHEVRELLNRSQNPLFFFDNDLDGLTSFLLLRKYCNKGKGVAIRSFPELNSTYSRKLTELNPDFVFILDKPLVSEEFFKDCIENNIQIVWIDHHPKSYDSEKYSEIYYFNPLLDEKPTNEPVSYWAYKIANKKEDSWISLLGCISDWYIPEFAKDLYEEYPALFKKIEKNEQAKALYETGFGKLAKILNFALKDRTSNVLKMIKYLLSTKTPEELLEKNSKNQTIYQRFKQIDRKYTKLIEKAKQVGKVNKNLLFFQYGGDLSISGELSNELFYNFPEMIIVVCYINGTKVNVSVRGNIDVRTMTAKALEGIESTTGGHEKACGASLPVEYLPKFRDNMIKLAKK